MSFYPKAISLLTSIYNALTGAGSPNKAEDTASANADIGTVILVSRRDGLGTTAPVPTSLDGDYSFVFTDDAGHVWVREKNAAAILTALQGTLKVGGNTVKKTSTPAISAAVAYTAGDNVGGLPTIADAFRVVNGSGILQDIDIWDKANEKAPFEIDFWSAPLVAGVNTDNLAQDLNDNHASWLGKVDVSAGDYKTTGTLARATITGVGLSVFNNADTAILYYTIKTTGAPTYDNVSDLVLKFGIFQD